MSDFAQSKPSQFTLGARSTCETATNLQLSNFVVFRFGRSDHLERLAVDWGINSISTPLAILPGSFVSAAIGPGDHAGAVLLAVLVLADVLMTVSEGVGALTFLSVAHESAFVLSSVRVRVDAFSLAVCVLEVSYVSSAGGPCIFALTSNLVLLPVAVVLLTTWPGANSFALALSGFEGAGVSLTIRPCHGALGAHHIVVELTFENLAVWESELTLATLFVFFPLTFVLAAIWEITNSVSVSLTLHKVAIVDLAARSDHLALAVLHVVLPLSGVLAVLVFEHAVAALHVVDVGTHIFATTVRPGHDALRVVHHIVAPLTFIAFAVHPDLNTETVALTILVPFAFVGGTVFDFLNVLLDSRRFNHLKKYL